MDAEVDAEVDEEFKVVQGTFGTAIGSDDEDDDDDNVDSDEAVEEE